MCVCVRQSTETCGIVCFLIGFPSAPLLCTPLPGVFALLPYPERQNQSQARWPTSVIPDSRSQDRKILMNFKASMDCGINILPL